MSRVILHVYDITNNSANNANDTIVQINRITRDHIGIGGIFHGAIEVNGEEWSFGYCPSGTGVFSCPPKSNPMYSWRESVDLGLTFLDQRAVARLIQGLSNEWRGESYDLLNRNCNHFCDELAIKLGTDGIPAWVNRFANFGDAAAEFAVASATQIQSIQNSLYGLGQAAYRCFWNGGSPEDHLYSTSLSNPSQDSQRHALTPSDAERLFPRSTQRSTASSDLASPDLPKDGLGTFWAYFGGSQRSSGGENGSFRMEADDRLVMDRGSRGDSWVKGSQREEVSGPVYRESKGQEGRGQESSSSS